MKVIKRNGNEVDFCIDKIINAIKKANKATIDNGLIPLTEDKESKVISTVQKRLEVFDKISVEDIQDMVEDSLIKHNCYDVAKSYIKFRENKKQNKKYSQDEEKIISTLDGTNESVKQDNSNKNVELLSTQRDYMAGIKSKTIVRKTWSKRIMDLHDKGVIHIHDTDYRAMRMTNCCLINLKDMLKNGFMLNGTFITTPSLFSIASNHGSQIALHVSSSQYGGQTMSWAHIARYVHSSRVIFRHQNIERLDSIIDLIPTNILKKIVRKLIRNKKIVDALTYVDVYRDIKKGVKTFQYQTNTISGSNGQSPFISMAINFAECEDEEHKEDLYLVTKEIFRQRIKGVLGLNKKRVSSLFPKLLYFLDEDTAEGGKYFDKLMPLVCECENERMSPDFISSKVQKKLKGVKIPYPCMGCRSFLTTEGSYFENGVEKKCNENFYGRHNNGVITINLPYVALESKKEYEESDKSNSLKDIFYKKLNDYLEIIYTDGFVQTYNRLKGTKAKVAPILWMWGGLTRKNAEDTIDDVICGWRSTYSLGYVGLWETSIAITNKNHIEDKSFAIEVLEFFNKKHDEWHKRLIDENNKNSFLNTSSYGTPEESTTEKFANALKRDFDVVEGVNDHNFVTNSYHIIPSYETKEGRGIDAYHKLEHESQFLSLSTGGAVSYVEIADMKDNLDVIESVINYMYNTILYAEFNIRKDICYKCGFEGEIDMIKNNGKLIWECPMCKNTNTKEMSILRRCCGYIFDASAGACQGRLSDINARKLNLGGGRTKNQNGDLII